MVEVLLSAGGVDVTPSVIVIPSDMATEGEGDTADTGVSIDG